MGEVFKARDTRLDRNVAIKVIATEFAGDARLQSRFAREARMISALNHPHICTLYDATDEYLVMELVDGESLADRLRRGPLPVDQAIRYGAEIAGALDAAHRTGIVHRDLKPGNVMLGRSGTKLLDFGLARKAPIPTADDATAQKALTAAGAFVGTFGYMSPEQLEGREADPRSDIFALGALIYEMVSGRRAYSASSPAGLIAAIMNAEPPSLRELQPGASAALERVVRKCLEKNPDDRWQSASDLADELRWVATIADSGVGTQAARRPRRWPAAVLAIAAISAIVAFLSWRTGGFLAGPPVVLLMDSISPDRIYSSITRAGGGTNADDLTNLLRDLPVTIIKENTSAQWNREDQVIRETPGIVVIHRSAFAAPTALIGDERISQYVWDLSDIRLRAFVGYVGLASPRTHFVVYSRDWSYQGPAEVWITDVERRFPHLRGRVATLEVHGRPEKSFRDPETGARLRQQIVARLGLE